MVTLTQTGMSFCARHLTFERLTFHHSDAIDLRDVVLVFATLRAIRIYSFGRNAVVIHRRCVPLKLGEMSVSTQLD